MNVLIMVWQFATLTGSEIYTYELVRCLAARQHKVTIAAARVGGEIAARARLLGVEVVQRDAVVGKRFDLLHLQQPEPTAWALARFPETPAVQTVHGRLHAYEHPTLHERIGHTICVLPEFRARAVRKYGVPEEQCSVIYNPVDFSRFNRDGATTHADRHVVLFAGSVDWLRAPMLRDLHEKAAAYGWELVVIGGWHLPDAQGVTQWVRPAVWDIERHIKEADAVAGLWLGRSIVEGWACGKPAWAYEYDDDGKITGVTLRESPDDMRQFDANVVTEQTLAVYEGVLNCVHA